MSQRRKKVRSPSGSVQNCLGTRHNEFSLLRDVAECVKLPFSYRAFFPLHELDLLLSMKNQRVSKRDVLTLAGVYLGLLVLVIALPDNNPTLSGFALGLYGLASFLTIERTS